MATRTSDPEIITDLIVGCLKHDQQGWMKQVKPLLIQHGYLNDEGLSRPDLINEMYLFDELCSTRSISALDHGREALFVMADMLGISEGKAVDHLARVSFWNIQSSTNSGRPHDLKEGQETLSWLFDYKDLATRRDMGNALDQGAIGLLMETWHEEPSLGVMGKSKAWSRQWASEFIGRVVQFGGIGNLLGTDVLSQEARAQSQLASAQVNDGLLLALMDNGVPWGPCLEDASVHEDFKATIRTHPLYVRAQLTKVATDEHRMASPRRGM